MKCASVQLSDRRLSARRVKSAQGNRDAPKKICQIRMADPSHEEDPRWKQEALERFHFDVMNSLEKSVASSRTAESNRENEVDKEMYLSVLNLDLPLLSENNPNSAPRQSFKYKTYPKSSNHHRMFVKQSITGHELDDSISPTQSSINMDCRIDDFVEDNFSTDTGQFSPKFSHICAYNVYETNANHDDLNPDVIQEEAVVVSTNSVDASTIMKSNQKINEDIDIEYVNNSIRNYAVKYQKSGKRRSLTISRTQSPETLEVIRVDVMCNYSGDSSEESDNMEDKALESNSRVKCRNSKKSVGCTPSGGVDTSETSRKPRLYNKIVLASTTERRNELADEDFSLLCKTFKFCDRDDRLSVWKSKSFS